MNTSVTRSVCVVVEEMSRAFEMHTTASLIGGIIAAGLTSLPGSALTRTLAPTAVTLHGSFGWLALPVCAVWGDYLEVCSAAFSRIRWWPPLIRP
jgi:hypothetical protein